MHQSTLLTKMSRPEVEPRATRLVLDSGRTARALLWGSGSPMLVLLHGIGDCAFVWNELVRTLSFPGTIVALDLPGHGDSDPLPAGRATVPELAKFVAEVLGRFDARTYVLVGHSLGAQVAIHLVEKLRRRTAALVLVEGGPYTRAAGNAAISNALHMATRHFDSIEACVDELCARLPLVEPRVLFELAQAMLKRNERGVLQLKGDPDVVTAVGFSPDSELISRLARVGCPSLVVRGNWSSVLPEADAQRMLDHIGIGSLAEVSGAGHCVPLENPAGLAGAVEPFLEQVLRLT
jgi:pimeloyl-ACP methyl ester carboxylesterase